jgi:single-stranded DNA-binding protein
MGDLLAKGKEVMVEGKLTSRSWEDKEGTKRYITEVVASDFLLLTRKEEGVSSKKEAADLPF